MVVHKGLQKLQLLANDICDPLLGRLMLPSLTDISIYSELALPFQTLVQKQLLPFLSRSKCKLDRLHLSDYDFECLKHDSCTSLIDLGIFIYTDRYYPCRAYRRAVGEKWRVITQTGSSYTWKVFGRITRHIW